MSEETNTSDSWGYQVLNCLKKKLGLAYYTNGFDTILDQQHKLTDKIESISVEDASENVDRSGGDNQRSLSRKPVMIQRTKQIQKKG